MAIKYYKSPFHVTESKEVANTLALKADICLMIRDIIENRGWNQTQASLEIDVTQPRVSDVINGKIDKFTLDALFSMLEKLGFSATFSRSSMELSSISIQKVVA